MDDSSAEEELDDDMLFDSPIHRRQHQRQHRRQHRRQQSRRERSRSGRRRNRNNFAAEGESQEPRLPARASSRQTAPRMYRELNSDDEQLNEMISTHTEPSGNFADDWHVSRHIFKLPRGDGENMCRDWLRRTGFQGNCLRRKMFCPQVGDSVVYIPRAHNDTLQKFPVQSNPTQPWKTWPLTSSWPVVCCTVMHVRYRFPYEMYYKSRCGIAAVLTLEISGVPSQSLGREFPWAAPSFVPCPNGVIQFEVTLFKCDEEDFLIPEYLFKWRIKELERAIVANGDASGHAVTVFCPPDNDNSTYGTDDINR